MHAGLVYLSPIPFRGLVGGEKGAHCFASINSKRLEQQSWPISHCKVKGSGTNASGGPNEKCARRRKVHENSRPALRKYERPGHRAPRVPPKPQALPADPCPNCFHRHSPTGGRTMAWPRKALGRGPSAPLRRCGWARPPLARLPFPDATGFAGHQRWIVDRKTIRRSPRPRNEDSGPCSPAIGGRAGFRGTKVSLPPTHTALGYAGAAAHIAAKQPRRRSCDVTVRFRAVR